MTGRAKATHTVAEKYNGLQIQSSVYGVAIPLCYGQNRVTFNLLQFEDFLAIPHTETQKTGGKGGAPKSTNTTWTYQAALAMSLGEGCAAGVYGIGRVWMDKEVHTLADLGLTLFNGADGQAPWSYLATHHPDRADAYPRTVYVAAASYQLGDSPSLPNLTFELTSLLPFNAGTINDAEPSAIVTDYLTEAQHGVPGFAPYLGDLSLFQDYCIARGLFLSPYENNQRAAASFIQDMGVVCNSAPVMRSGKFTLIPYGDEVITGNGRTYTPDLTPVFAITDDDWMRSGVTPPLSHTAKLPTQAYNWVRVQFNDRAIDYNTNVAEAKDLADIDDNGLVPSNAINFTMITSMPVAADVAMVTKNRALHVVNKYQGRLPVRYSLLECMDIVDLSSAFLGLSHQLCRVVEITEQDDAIDVTLEELSVGVASAPLFPSQGGGGYNQDYNETGGSIATPVIVNAPGLLTANGYETWIAAAGANPLWGGCTVWVSDDDMEYRRVGRMIAPCRYGNISADLLPGDPVDTVNVIHADLLRGQMLSGTAEDCSEWRTLLYVGGEWISYQNATLTSGTSYDIDTLERGGYGSENTGHAAGEDIIVVDEGVFRLPYDRGNIGKTVYFKFTSFNIFGAGEEDLADVSAFTHVLGASDITAPVTPTDAALLSINSGVTIIDCQRGTHFKLPLTANTEFQFQRVPPRFTWWVEVDQTGGFDLTLPANCVPTTGIPYDTSSGAGAFDIIQFITFDGGENIRYEVSQNPFSIALSPSPATGTANSVSGGNVSPSVVITATPTGASGGVTYLWERADTGAPTHAISSTTAANPTFSIASGHVVQSNLNTWRCTATDGLGRVSVRTVDITLSVTASGTPPFTASCVPAAPYFYRSTTRPVVNGGTAMPSGRSGPFTYSWVHTSGSANLAINGSSASASFNVGKVAGGFGTDTAVFTCTITDVPTGNTTTCTCTPTIETDSGL